MSKKRDWKNKDITLKFGDCLEVMKTMKDNSVDSIVTDPPYEIGFMGKDWDSSGIAYSVEMWTEALRVLKPGGHLLAFGATRSYHRMAVAIEDAGFEIRDSIHWTYGSGFPKSHDVSKAIDKAAGAEREVTGTIYRGERAGRSAGTMGQAVPRVDTITAPATDDAKQWDGWGTALKPSHEPIVMARKPISEKSVAANVLTWGTGAINIEASRIGDEIRYNNPNGSTAGGAGHIGQLTPGVGGGEVTGRWPANSIFDEEAGEELGEAARFFYCPKPSKKEKTSATKNTHPTVKPVALMEYLIRMVTPKGGTVLEPFTGSGTTLVAAANLGFKAIGIELTDEYVPIIKARVKEANK